MLTFSRSVHGRSFTVLFDGKWTRSYIIARLNHSRKARYAVFIDGKKLTEGTLPACKKSVEIFVSALALV